MSSVESEKVHVVVNTGSTRPYEIVATLLVCGSIGMAAYAMAQYGWLEIAATTITIFLIQMVKLLFSNGLLKLPEGGNGDFSQTSGFIKTAIIEYKNWLGKSPIWRLVAVAVLYTIGYMLVRMVMSWGLGIFTNIWVSGASVALLGALIIFPQLFSKPFKAVSRNVKAQSAQKDEA